MRQNSYFLFECYADGRFLFRSFSHDAAAENPRPESNPAYREAQVAARRAGHRLTYTFLATGLARRDAANRLQRYGTLDQDPPAEPPLSTASGEIIPQNPLVTWLPTSGKVRYGAGREVQHDS
jgi:hypothetical protein